MHQGSALRAFQAGTVISSSSSPPASSMCDPYQGLGAAVAVEAATSEFWPSAVTMLVEFIAQPSVVGTDAEVSVVARLNDPLVATGMETDLWQLRLEQLRADADYPAEEVERSQTGGSSVACRAGAGLP